MWTQLSHIIIKYRLQLVILLGVITLVLGFFAKDVEMSYDFSKTVPVSDPDMVYFQQFKETFGEDGNVVALGIQDDRIYTPENFTKLKTLVDELHDVEFVNDVLSLPGIIQLRKNEEETKFEVEVIFKKIPDNQHDLDSLIQLAKNQKFFSDRLLNEENGAMMILVSLDKQIINSSRRLEVTQQIIDLGENFEKDSGIDLRFAGLPFVRSVVSGRVANELKIFLLLSVLVTGLIMLLFFRSWDAVVFPMIIIAVVVVWVMGTIVLFGYKITILTGLIPPLIVVIGIPNSVYLLNKYHQEFQLHGNKIKAISRIIRKIGLVTLVTNFTTAIGFLVLLATDITILREFGIIAGINIMATFCVSIILIPAVFSWMPSPTPKQMRHLKFKGLDSALGFLDIVVHRYRPMVYAVSGAVLILSVVGMFKLRAVSYVVDDLPEDSPIKIDLAFFEENFSGVMPLEVVVDTHKRRGVIDLKKLKVIDEFEQFLSSQDAISQPLSLVSFVKGTRQAFYNNNPERYDLPTNNRERSFLLRYLDKEADSTGLFTAFVDSSMQKMRISMQVADIGSTEMDKLLNEVVYPKIDTLFEGTDMDVKVTGTTPLFIKGNKFLIDNLRLSLFLAFIAIALIMGILFANARMILISMIPNMIPLLLTAGLMGYFHIPLKPSTALIFSIAFGISVDDSIHFLAKYRQELFANDFFVPYAISKSLRETGASMMYTSIILFFGFVIFTFSDFGGTVALGILTSTTLLVAMVTNLILLPSLLMTFDDGKRKRNFHPIIEQYDSDEFYTEGEDEEIDLQQLKVKPADEGEEGSNINEDQVK